MVDQELDDLLVDVDVQVRPVAFDQLLCFPEVDLQNREGTLAKDLVKFAERLLLLKKRVETDETIHAFLVAEHEKVTTALKVKRDELVRVVCSVCKGTGTRAVDVLSGKIRGTAFEGTGAGGSVIVQNTTIDPMNACPACEGKRWQLMSRFKG